MGEDDEDFLIEQQFVVLKDGTDKPVSQEPFDNRCAIDYCDGTTQDLHGGDFGVEFANMTVPDMDVFVKRHLVGEYAMGNSAAQMARVP